MAVDVVQAEKAVPYETATCHTRVFMRTCVCACVRVCAHVWACVYVINEKAPY